MINTNDRELLVTWVWISNEYHLQEQINQVNSQLTLLSHQTPTCERHHRHFKLHIYPSKLLNLAGEETIESRSVRSSWPIRLFSSACAKQFELTLLSLLILQILLTSALSAFSCSLFSCESLDIWRDLFTTKNKQIFYVIGIVYVVTKGMKYFFIYNYEKTFVWAILYELSLEH